MMNIEKLLQLSALSLRPDEFASFEKSMTEISMFLAEIDTISLDDIGETTMKTIVARKTKHNAEIFSPLENVRHEVIGKNIAIKGFLG